jgi:sugar phosphate isomerase/epimerase
VAEREGVQLAIEPLNRYEADNVNNVREALDLISDRTYEHGLIARHLHMNIEERTIEDAIRRAGRKLIHVHVADSNRLAPGLGHIDFHKVIGALMDLAMIAIFPPRYWLCPTH